MNNQFITFCRNCGRQILMTRCEDTGRWVPCDPEIFRFRRAGGPCTFVAEDGTLQRGERDNNGEWGYRKHRSDCVRVRRTAV